MTTPGYRLLEFCQESNVDGIVDNVKHWLLPSTGKIQYSDKYIFGIVNYDSTDSGFYSPEDNYVWTPRVKYNDIGQSSGLINLTEPLNSDFRVV